MILNLKFANQKTKMAYSKLDLGTITLQGFYQFRDLSISFKGYGCVFRNIFFHIIIFFVVCLRSDCGKSLFLTFYFRYKCIYWSHIQQKSIKLVLE